jgi:hypothetical protein
VKVLREAEALQDIRDLGKWTLCVRHFGDHWTCSSHQTEKSAKVTARRCGRVGVWDMVIVSPEGKAWMWVDSGGRRLRWIWCNPKEASK